MPWQKPTNLLGNFVLRLLQVLAEHPLFLHTVFPEGVGSHTAPSTPPPLDVIKGSSAFTLGVLEFQNEETKVIWNGTVEAWFPCLCTHKCGG